MSESPETAGHYVGTLVSAILEPAKAGGLSEERASKIYQEIIHPIASLDGAFEHLAREIVEKWVPAVDEL